jgi:hypothetical protein
MTKPNTLPSLPEVARRIELCRQELAELRRMYRLMRAAAKADEARQERVAKSQREVANAE